MDDFAKSIGAVPRSEQQEDDFAKSIGATPKTQEQQEDPGKIAALIRSGLSGITFGASPSLVGALQDPEGNLKLSNILGAAEQAGHYLHLPVDINTPEAEDFRASRDAYANTLKQAEEAHPQISLAGHIGGAILPALATFGASAPESAAGVANELGTFRRMYGNAKTGALLGGAAGIAQDTSDTLNPSDVAKNAAIGAGTGIVLPELFRGVGKAHNLLKDKSTTYEELARIMGKTAGGMKLLGTEAKDAALQKFKGESDEIASGLSKARDVVGGKVSQTKSAEPAKDISEIISNLQKGIKSEAVESPVMSKVAPKLQNLESKIDEISAKHQNRLSEQTKRLIDLRKKSTSISAFDPANKSNIQAQISKTQSTINKLQDEFDTKLAKMLDQRSELMSEIKAEPRTESIFGSKEAEEGASKIQDMIDRLQQRAKVQGEDLTQASPATVEDIVSNLKNISPAGQAPLKSPEMIQQAETARKAIKGLDSEALQNVKQQYSKLAEADQALTGRSSDFLHKDQIAREDAIFKKMIQASKDNQTSDIRNMQLAEQAKLLQEAGQPELAEKVTGLAKGAGQDYIDALRVNPKNLHENIIPKTGAVIGESLHGASQIPANIIKSLNDSKFAGPAIQKLDQLALQNKFSQTMIDTAKKAISTQDQNKRNAAINVMLQSPTYRRLIKELLPSQEVEDGEQIK